MELVEKVLAGDRLALARLVSRIENNGAEARAALAALYPYTGRAHRVGVTGAPGTGKSTLVNEMAKVWRRQGQTVGIVAVDPTSPFSGGALLGDRIRMRDLAGDPGVFIRSMATRGSLGGLARATGDAVKVLDAAGFDIVLIETVGAGQSEVDIARTAHTVLVVEAPGFGDDVQAIKAGILEIADILVVNKADQPSAEHTARTLRAMLDLGQARRSWQPPILETVATEGQGVADVVEAVTRHRAYLETSGELARQERERVTAELHYLLREALVARWLRQIPDGQVDAAIERILAREVDPHTAVEELIASVGG
ncbi:MAG: methylmalonyl Co-A mutase-associated GTPase MeaB [Chloroflexota bacterium]